MILHYIKQWLLPLFSGLWFLLSASAQEIISLSPAELPSGSYVTGLYHIEADDGSGLYLKEQVNGSLTIANLDTGDPGFYFWVVENVYTDTFRLYSAIQQEKLLAVNTDGSTQFVTDATAATSKLLFRMYPEGAQRTAAHQGITAIGYITTQALTANYGNVDCRCNILSLNSNNRFRVHDAGIKSDNYRPIAFEKTNNSNSYGTVEIDALNSVTKITQDKPIVGFALPQNFVSSKFFVKGFGEDDIKITVASGTEGYIGFLDYTHHHFTKEVYHTARPKIGVKIQNDLISLIYLSGRKPLPFSQDSLGMEVFTDFVTGTPFTLGFKNQDSLVATQNGVSYTLDRTVPAELFLNQSVTQSGRMLVQLVEGDVELSYTTKNYLINSEDDFGTDDGSNFVSNHVFFPYNKGDTFLNTFDWQQTQWPVRYVSELGTVDDLVFSPFYSGKTEFSGISARFDGGGNYEGREDFAASEGWELIKADLGYNANGSQRNQAPAHPYIIFYDKVAATLRVFVYTNNGGEANQLTVSLSAMGGTPTNQQGYVPKLWGSLQQFSALDQVQNSKYEKPFPFYSASGRGWYFVDFVMEYDPCIAFFESTINLQIYKTTKGDLTMVGRFEGGSLPADTPEYNGWQNQREDFLMGVMDNNFGALQNTLGDITFNHYQDFNLMDFQNEVGGVLTGAAIDPWEKEKAKIEWEATETIGHATIAEGTATIIQGAAQIAESVPFAEKGAKVVGGLATIAAGSAIITSGEAELRLAHANKLYYDAIKDKVKEDDQEITMQVPPPRPHAVFGELALKGTLTIQTTLIPEAFITTPGGLNSNNAPEWYVNGSRGARPLYNKPMGKFTLLKQPQFGIGIVKSNAGTYGGAWLKIKEKPYFAHNNTVMGKIDDVLTLSIQVQTLNTVGTVIHNAAGPGYTNLFDAQNGRALPGEMDISNLIKWDQIHANIATLSDPTDQEIKNELSKWIRVSYEVWSLTLTNLKSRNLSRVFASGDQYYTGISSFAYNSSNTFINQLAQEAKMLATNQFTAYNFSDDVGFGDTYRFYHTAYDEAGDDFYDVMNNYCTALNAIQNPEAKHTGEVKDIKGEEVSEEGPVAGELAVQPGLTTYPNPVRHQLNFRLVSEQAGEAKIVLYDLLGRTLINTSDYLNGNSTLQGLVNMGGLQPGIYILKVQLPDGKSITKKIIKK